MEADFIQYYHTDVRDLWLDDNLVTCRWVADLMIELPDTSRFMRAVRKDFFSLDNHMQADVIDLLTAILYQTSIAAAAKAGKQYAQIMRKAPKPFQRPGDLNVKTAKVEFTNPRDLDGQLTKMGAARALNIE